MKVFKSFEKMFGSKGRKRIVGVLSGFAARPDITNKIVGFRGAGRAADALAIGPYLGCETRWGGGELLEASHPAVADDVVRAGVDGLMAACNADLGLRTVSMIRSHKRIAKRHRMPLVAYEGGVYLARLDARPMRSDVSQVFRRASRDPRMEQLYDRYYRAWRHLGGGRFNHFLDYWVPSVPGHFGMLEYQSHSASRSSK